MICRVRPIASRGSLSVLAPVFAVAAALALPASATSSDDRDSQRFYVKPLDARHSPFMGGNRSPRLRTGRQGRIAVIAQGQYLDGSVAVIVRNNTPRVAQYINVLGVATSPRGRLLATGKDQEMYPSHVKPGEIAFGYVYFGSTDPPSNARFKLTATDGPTWKRDAFGGDLVIRQSGLAPGRVVGFARNPTRERIEGPIDARAACFTKAGTLIDARSDFTDQGSVPPKGMLPFDVELYDTPCLVFLVAVKGFTS